MINYGANSQTNLVPNWSFEELLICPSADITPVYQSAYPWFSPSLNTPDIFNICNNNAPDHDSVAGVPRNGLGFQIAHSGNGYAGFARYAYGEYLSVKLTSPLKSGKKYCISFYVNPGNYTYYVLDAIGAYISDDSIHENNYNVLPFTPQIENQLGIIISDTVNWTEISGEYTAIGGEHYITIGSFFPDSIIHYAFNDTINPPGSWPYYFLDDVSVYYCGPDTIEYPNELTIPNAFTPNNDGVNDNFITKGKNIKSLNGKIFNRWGQELFSFANPTDAWNGKYKGNDVSEGVYFYVIRVGYIDGSLETKKGSVELIR